MWALSLCGHKTGAFKHRKTVSFNIGLCSDPCTYMVMNLGLYDWSNIISSASGRTGMFAKSPCCDTPRQSAQLWNSQSPECRTSFSSKSRNPMLRWFGHVPRQVVLAKPRESGPESSKDQVEWLHLRPYLVPSCCGVNRITWNCCWLWGISNRPGAAAPRPSPRETGMKMNEWMDLSTESLKKYFQRWPWLRKTTQAASKYCF